MKKWIKIALIVIAVLIVLNLIVFISFFHSQKISNNVSDWANFADYIGRTTNILISVMTLLVTIFIAYEIAKLDEKRNAANIEYDKRKFMREMREKEYADISNVLIEVRPAITDRENVAMRIYVIQQRFAAFFSHKRYLFPKLEFNKFSNIHGSLGKIFELCASGDFSDNLDEKTVALQAYGENFANFHQTMQEYMMSEAL